MGDVHRLRRKDLQDIAVEVKRKVDERGPQSVFMLADGRVKIVHFEAQTAERYRKEIPHAFVGTYDHEACEGDIEEDLAAMERPH